MATEVEEIARRKSGDEGDDGGDKPMGSYDDVETNAYNDLKDEIGEKGANAVRDYVKACIEKASSDDSDDDDEE